MFAPFYHQLLRRYHIAFGSLFNNLTLVRNDANNKEAQRFVVPLEYTARESWLSRMRQDPNLDRHDSVTVPRLAYEMTAMRYDPTRKLNSLNQRTLTSLDGNIKMARRYFSPTPYVLSFSLYALTRSVEDANQITEQIIPYFTPSYSLLVKLIPSLGILDRMKIVMESGSPQWSDSFETSQFAETREILLTFNFSVSANFYGPISAVPPSIIRHIMVDLYNLPSGATLSAPNYFILDDLSRVLLEDVSGRLIDEDSNVDLISFAKQARIDIVPNPLDAAPVKPVNTTTTITEYYNGEVFNVFTGRDEILDI